MFNKAFFLLLVAEFALGDIKVSGIIRDSESGNPIALVNIWDATSNAGTTTNESGLFTLIADDKEDMNLAFTHIAYDNVHHKFDQSDTTFTLLMTETLLQMNDVVVTSTRSGYLLRDVPIATEVIGTKEINESGAVTVNELLLQRAGVSTSVNVDGGVIFNMLGLDSRYILILKDGQPITGRFNNRVDLDQVSTSNIRKIEITKGPGSAVYGTDAMGGVINIITQRPSEALELDITYRASSFGGTPKEISKEPINSILKSRFSAPIKSLRISSALTYQHFSKGQQFEYISADQIDKINLNTDLSWEKFQHQFQIGHQYFNQEDEGATRLSNGITLFTNATNIHRNQLTLNHFWEINEKISIRQTLRRAGYKRLYEVKNVSDDMGKSDITTENNTEYELLFKHENENIKINGGFELSNPLYKSDRIAGGKQEKNVTGVFNQVALKMYNNFDFVAGLRADKYGDTTVVSPRLALSLKPNKMWTLRASFGSGFRAPSFMESLIDWEHVQFGYTVRGNPNLKPEVSRGITIGAEYSNQNNLQVSTLVYHNDFSNLIKDYALESGILSYQNIEKAYFTGLEIITKWVITSSISSSFTINYVKNEDEMGKQIPNTIPLSFGGRVSYSPGKQNILFALNLKGVGEYFPQEFDPTSGDYLSASDPIKSYLVSDIQLICNLTSTYQVVLGSTNIGNHTNKAYGPYIGRAGYLEIKTRLGKE
tara:strand:- start:839 stop:2974 length:2136 start_codon:yes stop_codon:yes gene_type:complete